MNFPKEDYEVRDVEKQPIPVSISRSLKSSKSSESTKTSETCRMSLASDSPDYYNFPECFESCSSLYSAPDQRLSNTDKESDVRISDGRVLKQVPGRPYLFYQENHSMIKNIFGEILKRTS